MKVRALMALFPLVLAASGVAQTVVYVNESATGANTGTAWADAFIDLQDALAVATPGDEIWIAAGMYTPSPTDATLSFVLVDSVALFGGFVGDETSLSQRDWVANETILSGDIGRDDVVGSGTNWHGGWNQHTPNSGHVIVADGVGLGTILDGLVIADGAIGPVGTSAGSILMVGSGKYSTNSSPVIRNCTFTHNLAAFGPGGGIYAKDSDLVIDNCRFVENLTNQSNGGGLYTTGMTELIVRDTVFERNHVIVSPTSSSGGGGLAHNGTGPLFLERCVFTQNISRRFPGATSGDTIAGGLLVNKGFATINDCVFIGNKAHNGGGMWTWDSGSLTNCLFKDNVAVVELYNGQWEVGGSGAGLVGNSFSPGEQVDLINCTFVDNTGKRYSGAVGGGYTALVVENCVFWGNTATHPDFIGFWESQVSKSFDTIGYSCVQFLFGPKKLGEDPLEPSKRPGSIEDDPQFATGSFMLDAGSPCIDSARNTTVPAGVTLDLAGELRFVDDPNTPDTGVGPAPIIDMGAYEYQPESTCYADCDGSGALNILDYICFGDDFAAGGSYADCDGSGSLNILDYICFGDAFATGCP